MDSKNAIQKYAKFLILSSVKEANSDKECWHSSVLWQASVVLKIKYEISIPIILVNMSGFERGIFKEQKWPTKLIN